MCSGPTLCFCGCRLASGTRRFDAGVPGLFFKTLENGSEQVAALIENEIWKF